jgi:inositol-1,4,5-trisphosphate 5-phosphatase
MVNVHLFHDASNLLAVEQSPSIYSKFRKNALEHTLQRYMNNCLFLFIRMNFSLPLHPSDIPVPYVIFGDFNFRLDAHRLLEVNLF